MDKTTNNREILFKGIELATGKWIESDSIWRIGGMLFLYGEGWTKIDPSTLCQFAGYYYHDHTRVWNGTSLEATSRLLDTEMQSMSDRSRQLHDQDGECNGS